MCCISLPVDKKLLMSLVGQNGDEIYGGDDDLFEIGDDEFDGKDLSKTLLDCIG